jgi:hypothetical protein
MQGLASVFIALSLLLSPLTGDHNGANNSASGDGAMTLRQQAEHANGPMVSSIEGGSKGAMTIRDNDNSDCPYKYPDLTSKDYCECVVGRSDNFICNVRASHLAFSTLIEVLVLTSVFPGSTIAPAHWEEFCASRRAAVRAPPLNPLSNPSPLQSLTETMTSSWQR